MKPIRFKIPMWLLLRIAERDLWRCHICSERHSAIPGDLWEIDHETPLAKGGTNHVRNLRLAHASCNRVKADA